MDPSIDRLILDKTHLDNLDLALQELSQKTKNRNAVVIVGGDFNCPSIDWTDQSTIPGCANRPLHERLLEILSDSHLTQMQQDPTRLGNVLDLYCTNKPNLWISVK